MKKKDKSKEYTLTPQGSLGILALGSVGIRKWREEIQKALKKEKSSKPTKE